MVPSSEAEGDPKIKRGASRPTPDEAVARERRRRAAAIVLVVALDGAVTLLGQSSLYWEGFRAAASENQSIGLAMLRIHPSAFVAFLACYAALLVTASLRAPETVSRVVATAVLVGHGAGAATWLANRFGLGYAGVAALAAAWAPLAWSAGCTLAPSPVGPRRTARTAFVIGAAGLLSLALLGHAREKMPAVEDDPGLVAIAELERGYLDSAERLVWREFEDGTAPSAHPCRRYGAYLTVISFYRTTGRRGPIEGFAQKAEEARRACAEAERARPPAGPEASQNAPR